MPMRQNLLQKLLYLKGELVVKDRIQTITIWIILTIFIGFSSASFAGDWGRWKTVNKYDGLDFRVRCGDYNDYAQKYHWSYEFRNRYRKEVSVYYTVYDKRGNENKGGMTIRPGGTQASWGLFGINCSRTLWMGTRKVEFE
jgi:hypothetical protein